MGRRAKPPRLWLRPQGRDGNRVRAAEYIIRDGRTSHRTGCGPDNLAGAEERLRLYLATKHAAEDIRRDGDPAQIPVADVISIYLQDVAPRHARPHETAARAEKLLDFWADPSVARTQMQKTGRATTFTGMLADVRGITCRAYVDWRMETGARSTTAARRELEDLRSAINHHHREGYTRDRVAVVLPDRPQSRDRWLSRDEAAALLWAAWRYRHPLTGERRRAHVARFILVALYTGSRAGAVCGARLRRSPDAGYIDLAQGVLYRKGSGERETKKRRPPVPVPGRLLAHIRRWVRLGIATRHVVEFHGNPVLRVSTGFASAVRDAGLSADVTPHVLRHTAATWLMQNRTDIWEAAGFIGATPETVAATYGHHHPDHLRGAAQAITGRAQKGTVITERKGKTGT